MFAHTFAGAKDTYTESKAAVTRDNDASSFKLQTGCCIELFDEKNFGGKRKTLCESTQFCTNTGCDWWNDKISSFKLFLKGQYFLFYDQCNQHIREYLKFIGTPTTGFSGVFLVEKYSPPLIFDNNSRTLF